MSFVFETRDVEVPTGAFVRKLLADGRGGFVYGGTGTGKSHAVRSAVQDGLHVDVAAGPLLGQRFAADIARQLGPDGRLLLETVRHDGLKAALAIADHAINGYPFVVDGANRLLDGALNPDEPATALWQQEKSLVLAWLYERLNRSPTFLVGRWRPLDMPKSPSWHHRPPRDWPIVLQRTPDGFHDWLKLGTLAQGNPAILTVARALVPLVPASDFNDLIYQAEGDEVSAGELLRRLGSAFQACAPLSWQQALALLAVLGEAPRDILAPLFSGGEPREPAAEDPPSPGAGPSVLKRLEELKLIEARRGGLAVLPALLDAGAIRPLSPHERSELLRDAAHRLLAPLNDLRSLEPGHADRVLRAHGAFVELGDMANAEKTAALHVHGLVDLARRTSRNEDYKEAFQQYDGLLRLMQAGTFGLRDEIGLRLSSYVKHYRAWNGWRAGVLDDATCLGEYTSSLVEWPDNALWHQRTIQGMIRMGRIVEARDGLNKAYRSVPDHPRRDELLRVRPAQTAMSEGAPLLSLELIDPILDAPAELYPEVADGRDELLGRWSHGALLSELPFREEGGGDRCVVFQRKAKVSVQPSGIGWVARLPDLAAEGRSTSPLSAVEALARHLGKEILRLIATPSSDLGVQEVRRKGRLLSLVDAMNSDIGIEHAAERWLVGRIEDGRLIPVMRSLPAVEIPASLSPESTEGLYFARVPVYRDGIPSGPVEALKPAGRGRSLGDLVALLADMSGDAA